MLDPQIAALGDYQWIPGTAWPQPDWIVRAPPAKSDTTYKVLEPAIRGVLQTSYSTRAFTYKTNQVEIKAAKHNNLGMLSGAAPTSGVYTGIPSGCNGGMGGGNPYS